MQTQPSLDETQLDACRKLCGRAMLAAVAERPYPAPIIVIANDFDPLDFGITNATVRRDVANRVWMLYWPNGTTAQIVGSTGFCLSGQSVAFVVVVDWPSESDWKASIDPRFGVDGSLVVSVTPCPWRVEQPESPVFVDIDGNAKSVHEIASRLNREAADSGDSTTYQALLLPESSLDTEQPVTSEWPASYSTRAAIDPSRHRSSRARLHLPSDALGAGLVDEGPFVLVNGVSLDARDLVGSVRLDSGAGRFCVVCTHASTGNVSHILCDSEAYALAVVARIHAARVRYNDVDAEQRRSDAIALAVGQAIREQGELLRVALIEQLKPSETFDLGSVLAQVSKATRWQRGESVRETNVSETESKP